MASSTVTSKLVQKVKIAQKQLGMDDDSYRALLFALTGKRSATELNKSELDKVLARMRQMGFKDTSKPYQGQISMIKSLWRDLHNAGKVEDVSDGALSAYAKRQFGVDALEWLDVQQCQRMIEQLKQWLGR